MLSYNTLNINNLCNKKKKLFKYNLTINSNYNSNKFLKFLKVKF